MSLVTLLVGLGAVLFFFGRFAHARELTFTMSGTFHTLEWVRIGADMVFLVVGVVPLVWATFRIVLARRAGTDLPMADAAA